MRALHLEAMHAYKFSEYVNMASGYVANGELYIGMQFNEFYVLFNYYHLIYCQNKIFHIMI